MLTRCFGHKPCVDIVKLYRNGKTPFNIHVPVESGHHPVLHATQTFEPPWLKICETKNIKWQFHTVFYSHYRCSCHAGHSSRSILPQDSGFPSASKLLLPLLCTTRASDQSPHKADSTAVYKHTHTYTQREPTQGTGNTGKRKSWGRNNHGRRKWNEQAGS